MATTGMFSFTTLPLVVEQILKDAAGCHELNQMLDALSEDEETTTESKALRDRTDKWFITTKADASGAKSYASASDIILQRLPALVAVYQRIATLCIDIVGKDSIQIPPAGLWWYKEETDGNDNDRDPLHYYQGAVLQMFAFFGLSDLLCAIVSLGALGTDHSDLLETPECGHEPFTALVLSQSYEIIDRLNIHTLGNVFFEYICAVGFACKVLPDTQEVAESLACGYDGRKYLPKGMKNPYMEGGTPLHGFVEAVARSSQESWAVICAAHVIMEMGGSLMTANDKFETPIQIVSQSDGIVFAFFMHCIAMQGIQEMRGTGPAKVGEVATGATPAESKDAATKAEVEELRQELRDTKQQFGNILLLFGKILGLQAQQKQKSGGGARVGVDSSSSRSSRKSGQSGGGNSGGAGTTAKDRVGGGSGSDGGSSKKEEQKVETVPDVGGTEDGEDEEDEENSEDSMASSGSEGDEEVMMA